MSRTRRAGGPITNTTPAPDATNTTPTDLAGIGVTAAQAVTVDPSDAQVDVTTGTDGFRQWAADLGETVTDDHGTPVPHTVPAMSPADYAAFVGEPDAVQPAAGQTIPAATVDAAIEPATVDAAIEPATVDAAIEPATVTPGEAFTNAWLAALGERDVTTGTGSIPIASLSTVAAAFRNLRGTERSSLPAALASQTMVDACGGGAPDASMMLAAGCLLACVATATTKPAKQAVAPVPTMSDDDKTAIVMNAADMLASLADALRTASVDEAYPVAEQVRAMVWGGGSSAKSTRTTSGTKSTREPRAPGVGRASMPRHIQQAVAAGARTLRDVTAAHTAECPDGARSAGAVLNRWEANDVPGVTAVTDPGGAKSFVPAT